VDHRGVGGRGVRCSVVRLLVLQVFEGDGPLSVTRPTVSVWAQCDSLPVSNHWDSAPESASPSTYRVAQVSREAEDGKGLPEAEGYRPPHVALGVRALGHVARALVHSIPGVTNVQIPLDTLVRPILIHVQQIAWAPVIWAVAACAPGTTVACLGGACVPQPARPRPQEVNAVVANPTNARFSLRRCRAVAGRIDAAAMGLEDSFGAAQPT
jgi:hypothetical protein